MESYFWLILFIVFLIFEVITLGLATIWFAGGAFISFWMSVAGIGFIWQIIVFFLVSVILLCTTRPLASKYLNKNTTKTNVEELIGKHVKVSETIDNINETKHDGMLIQQGTVVCILEINGVKAIVQPVSMMNHPVQEKKEND